MTFSWAGRILAEGRGRWQDDSNRPESSSMIPSFLDHLVVNVSDVNRACDFYARVLGAEIVGFGAPFLPPPRERTPRWTGRAPRR